MFVIPRAQSVRNIRHHQHSPTRKAPFYTSFRFSKLFNTSIFHTNSHIKDTNYFKKKCKILTLTSLLTLAVAFEVLSFKATAIAFPMSAFTILSFYYILYTISMLMICLYNTYITHHWSTKIFIVFSQNKYKYLPLSIFQALSTSIIFVAISREIPGSLLIIFLQLSVPISIIMNQCIFQYIKIHKTHLFAIALIIIGTIFGCIASITGDLGANYISANGQKINAYVAHE